MAHELLSELEALKVRNDILEGELADLKAQLKHNNQQLAEAQTASKGLQSQLMQREKMASLGELTGPLKHPWLFGIELVQLKKSLLIDLLFYRKYLLVSTPVKLFREISVRLRFGDWILLSSAM